MPVLGELVWKIVGDTRNFDKSVKTADKGAERLGKRVSNISRSIAGGFATIGFTKLGQNLVKAASDFEETQSKFSVVFSTIRKDADRAAEELAEGFGFSSKAALQLLSDTGDLLTGFGFTQDAALDLSNRVNRLSADLASFTNFEGGAERASQALTKALLGETEQAKALGIVIRQDSDEFRNLVKQYQVTEDATLLQAKALAALEIATNQSKNAIGDFERTQDSFANRTRILQADIDDLQVSLGTALLPVAQTLIDVFSNVINAFNDLDEDSKTLILVIGGITAAVVALSAAFAFLAANPVVAAIAAIVGVVTAVGLLITESKTLDQVTDDLTDATEEYKKVNDELKESQDQLTEAEKKQLENRKQLLRADFVRQIGKLNSLITKNSREVDFNRKALSGLERGYEEAVNRALEFAATVDEAPRRLQRRVASLATRIESTKAEIVKLEDSGKKAFDALARGVASGIISEGDLLTVSKENRAEILRRVDAIKKLEKQQADSNKETQDSDKETADNKKFLTDEELERIQELERIKQEIRLRELTGAQEDLARELLDIETEKQAFIEAGLEKELAEKEAQRRLTEFLAQQAEERTAKQEEEFKKQLDFVDTVIGNIAGAFGSLLQIRVDQIKKEGEAQANLTEEQKSQLTALALAQKSIAVVTSIIDGIVAVQKNLANPLLAVATGIAAAANTAAIIAQPIPSFQGGGIVGPTPGGRLVRTAENGSPELLLNSGQSGKKFLNEFADSIATRIGKGVTIQQNNMINLGTEEGLRQAARALFPLMEEEKLRRGDG